MSTPQPDRPALPPELAAIEENAAFRHALVGMVLASPEFTILSVNGALAESLGYRVEEMAYLPPDRFTHAEDLAGFAEHLSALALGGAANMPYRKRCLKSDGDCLLCDLTFTPIHGGGAVVGWLCQVQDVTVREHAIALLEQERRLFVRGPVVGFRWRNAPGWPVEYVSPNLEAVLGWPPEKLLRGDLSYAELIHPEDVGRIERELDEHLEAGRTSFVQTYRLKDRSGLWRWVRDFQNALRNEGGEVTHYEGYILDDTERVSQQQDLARLLRFSRQVITALTYEDLVATTHDELSDRLGVGSVMIYRADRSEPRRFRLIAGAGPSLEQVQNEAADLALDDVPLLQDLHSHAEVIYCRDARTDPRADHEIFRRFDARGLLVAPLFHDAQAMGSLWTGTQGEAGALELSEADLEYFRHLAGIVALAFERIRSDLEWRSAQVRLRQVEKLEAVGQLAGGVAHNFNNALTVILGHASLMLESAPPGTAQRNGLEAILRSGEGSAKAVSQLLQFARPLPDRKQERIEPGPGVTEFAKMLRAVLDESVRLVVRCDVDLPTVAIEGGAFTMILMNLVLNARDAMGGSGRLVIRATREQRREANWLRLEVEDDGCGMDAAVQARIFEPFFTTKGEEGTGLGLAAVYGAVTRAGGTIEVRSALGQGSCFTIRLPEAPAQVSAVAEVVEPAGGGGRRLLIVEDEEAVRVFTARALRAQGYHVTSVPQASAALELLSRNHFDLVLADVVMHGMDGFALAREIARLEDAPLVLLMSGYPGSERATPLPPAVRGLLRKPFTAGKLAAAVARAFSDAAPDPDEFEATAS